MNNGGKMHGIGRKLGYLCKDGAQFGVYEGQFVNGWQKGYGREIFIDGSYYIGFFGGEGYINGGKHGQGKLFKADGTLDKSGLFEKGKFVQ